MRLLLQEECDLTIEMFGESSGSVKQKIDRVIPQLTTDVLFCADANLNDKTACVMGIAGAPP